MKTKTLYAIMRAISFGDIIVTPFNNMPLQSPPEGPDYFLPVFDSREKAEAWLEGRYDHPIAELEVMV